MRNADPTTAVIPAAADMTGWESVRDFQRRCERSLARPPRRLVLDLTRVTGTDSKLMAYLVVALCRARRAAVTVEIKPSACVRRWVRHCQLGPVLHVDE